MADQLVQNNFFKPDYTPPSAFYFSVKFSGFPEMDSIFEEVSGLKVNVGTEVKEAGGDDHQALHLPRVAKFENLVLKRCLMYNSALNEWCQQALEDFKFSPKNIKLQLLGADGNILASWSITQAFPISWELSKLNSTSDQSAIETLTLKYRYFKKDR